MAWSFTVPGLTGSGARPEAAVAALGERLKPEAVEVVERFEVFLSPNDPDSRQRLIGHIRQRFEQISRA